LVDLLIEKTKPVNLEGLDEFPIKIINQSIKLEDIT